MLQDSLRSVDSQTELLRSKLQAVGQEKADQAQEVANHQRMLQEAQDKVGDILTMKTLEISPNFLLLLNLLFNIEY